MKKLIGIVALTFAVSSIAASVKINSFHYVRTNPTNSYNVLAELCGTASDVKMPAFVNAKIDYNGSNPGSYNTITDENGNFCMVVATYRGVARVSLIGADAQDETKIK